MRRRKKPTISRSTYRFRSLRLRSRARRRSHRPKRPNYWHQHDDWTYSKIVIRTVELLWLEQNAPTATVTWEKVPGCENMPLYKSGKWNGMAHFVRFKKEDTSNAIMFRIVWWNNSI